VGRWIGLTPEAEGVSDRCEMQTDAA
jgi:hypothetical protein